MIEEAAPQNAAPQAVKRPRGRPRKVRIEDVEVSAPAAVRTPVKRVRKVAPKSVVPPAPPSAPITPIQYVFAVGRRKRAVARVFVYREGGGEIEVNGRPLNQYFGTETLHHIAREALEQSPFKKSVRIVVKIQGGGLAGQAEAVRLGIARALLIWDESLRPAFRARGYLTRDPREKERKKPGLKRARRAPQWQKR